MHSIKCTTGGAGCLAEENKTLAPADKNWRRTAWYTARSLPQHREDNDPLLKAYGPLINDFPPLCTGHIGKTYPGRRDLFCRRVAVAALLATTISASSEVAYAQQFQPPAATELWTLQSKCTALGEQKRQEDFDARPHPVGWVPANLSTSYNPTDNRCYIKTERIIDNPRETTTTLYDGQTGETLAVAMHRQSETSKPDFFTSKVADKRYEEPKIDYRNEPDDPRMREHWFRQVAYVGRYYATLEYMDRLMNGGKP